MSLTSSAIEAHTQAIAVELRHWLKHAHASHAIDRGAAMHELQGRWARQYHDDERLSARAARELERAQDRFWRVYSMKRERTRRANNNERARRCPS